MSMPSKMRKRISTMVASRCSVVLEHSTRTFFRKLLDSRPLATHINFAAGITVVGTFAGTFGIAIYADWKADLRTKKKFAKFYAELSDLKLKVFAKLNDVELKVEEINDRLQSMERSGFVNGPKGLFGYSKTDGQIDGVMK